MTQKAALKTDPKAALLQGRADGLAYTLAPLLARALRLADGIMLGEHGRRKPGAGDAFWQYRPAIAGDSAGAIDWRRSARSDQQFVQQKEWQAAQTVMVWADIAASMRYASAQTHASKKERAALLALAVSTLLIRGGERVGMGALPAGRGQVQLRRLAAAFSDDMLNPPEYGVPDTAHIPAHAHAVFLSDFLGDIDIIRGAVTQAAERGIKGVLVQVLDPAEEVFPFQGRIIFESIGKEMSHETRKAGDLRERYQARLANRKSALAAIAKDTGWQYYCDHTDARASGALLWIYNMLEGRS